MTHPTATQYFVAIQMVYDKLFNTSMVKGNQCLSPIFADISGDLVPTKIPLRYETTQQQSVTSVAQRNVYRANLDCNGTPGSEVVVCAENVDNWRWDTYVVIMDIYNDKSVS